MSSGKASCSRPHWDEAVPGLEGVWNSLWRLRGSLGYIHTFYIASQGVQISFFSLKWDSLFLMKRKFPFKLSMFWYIFINLEDQYFNNSGTYDFGEERFCVEGEVSLCSFIDLEGKGLDNFWRLWKPSCFLKVNEIYLEDTEGYICLILKTPSP